MARTFAAAFYKSDAWQECRRAYAKSVGWLCEDCLARGLYTPGKVVHHIVPLSPENIGDPKVTLSWSNLRLVCQDCHAKEHASVFTERYAFNDRGEILPPRSEMMKPFSGPDG